MQIGQLTYVALFLLSFGALMAEVALIRLFSFSLWYHFAYMTISVALLGYGAAGSTYFAFPRLTSRGVERALVLWALVAAGLLLACLVIVSHVPLDPATLFPRASFRPSAQPIQFAYLAVFYLAVIAPYFAIGLCITILLSNAPARIPLLYFADLVGAAAGCLGAVALLEPLGAPGVIVLGATLLAVAGALFLQRGAMRWALAAAVVVAAGIAGPPLAEVSEVQPSQTKFISQILARPGTQRLFKSWSPVYRVDVLGGREGSPFRLGHSAGWGVSDRYRGPVPENLVVTHDGDGATMIYRFDGDFDALEFIDHSVLRLPYLLVDAPEVFVIGVGGGVDLLTALKYGARHVTGIELNPVTVNLLKHDYADYTSGVFNRPEVTLRAEEGRSFLQRSDARFDLIQITGVDTLAAIYSGAYVLSESYVYTVEAMGEYLSHLAPGGVFSMTRGDLLLHSRPPPQILRLLATLTEALARFGIERPGDHIVVTMSSGHAKIVPIFNILVKLSPFSEQELTLLQRTVLREGFVAWQIPGQQFDNPASDFLRLDESGRAAFHAASNMNLTATRDDKPFFFNFFKWRTLLGSLNPFADYTLVTGQLVLLAILAQSLAFGALLIFGPLLRGGLLAELGTIADRYRYLVYFACLGMGFIVIEISYIQRFTLFLGSPVYSLSVTLASLLFFSGVGSFLSDRLGVLADTGSALRRLALALVVLNALYIGGLPGVFGLLLGAPLGVRIALTMLLLAPAGIVMGSFFPIGMRVLGERAPRLIPWAWAANGVTGVIGSILCIVLAISLGFRVMNMLAVGVYLVGVLTMLGPATRSRAAVAGLRPSAGRARGLRSSSS